MKKLFKNSNLSLRTAMIMLVTPAFIALITAVFIFSNKTRNAYDDAEEIFYSTLYQANNTLINADRDFYQAMLAATEYYNIQNSDEVSTDSGLQSVMKQKMDEYEENRQQTIDRVTKSADIARENEEIWTGTKHESGSTYSALYDNFTKDFSSWKFDPSVDITSWTAFRTDFEDIRDYINAMQEILEQWAEEEDAAMTDAINKSIVASAVSFMVAIVLLLMLAIVTANSLAKGIIRLSNSIDIMAGGDFVTTLDSDSPIKEFKGIGKAADGLRINLCDSLRNVIASANNVNDGAIETKNMIADSRRTAEDINNAVNDLANGATSMAGDVQITADEAGGIGTAVDEVYNSATSNMERGRKVSEESAGVQRLLSELQKAGENTRSKAVSVSESVNSTAEVVGQISNSAQAIIDIASQTNLLALNASIEAARAGEAGRGFAVVADSIKNLAEESDVAAKEITNMLTTIMQLSEQNKQLTDDIRTAVDSEAEALSQMNVSFDDMEKLLAETDDGNKQIVSLVEALNHNKENIINSVESLSSVSEEFAASTEESAASLTALESNMTSVVDEAEKLLDVSNEMQKAVSIFKV